MLQLDDGADFIKLYLDGPDPETPPWTAADVRRVVDAAHARGARVTAHAGRFAGTSVCADAGVDCVEHGFETDAETAAVMARRGVAMVTTMTVLKSWASFEHTTRLERFSSAEGRRLVHQRTEVARESVRLAYRAGVVLAAGTDFGGGSARPTRWHGRSRRWWTAGWNPGRRWRRPPGGAARSVASRRRG